MGDATSPLSAHDADRTMAKMASCSTKACIMPVMKLICGDKRLADCYCSTRVSPLSIADHCLIALERSMVQNFLLQRPLCTFMVNRIQNGSWGYSCPL